jgi:hypothetical protein
MPEALGRTARILCALGLTLGLLAAPLVMTGCVGYVRGDGGVVVAEPDFLWFGGYGDGGFARGYGDRGWGSRGGRR